MTERELQAQVDAVLASVLRAHETPEERFARELGPVIGSLGVDTGKPLQVIP